MQNTVRPWNHLVLYNMFMKRQVHLKLYFTELLVPSDDAPLPFNVFLEQQVITVNTTEKSGMQQS